MVSVNLAVSWCTVLSKHQCGVSPQVVLQNTYGCAVKQVCTQQALVA